MFFHAYLWSTGRGLTRSLWQQSSDGVLCGGEVSSGSLLPWGGFFSRVFFAVSVVVPSEIFVHLL